VLKKVGKTVRLLVTPSVTVVVLDGEVFRKYLLCANSTSRRQLNARIINGHKPLLVKGTNCLGDKGWWGFDLSCYRLQRGFLPALGCYS